MTYIARFSNSKGSGYGKGPKSFDCKVYLSVVIQLLQSVNILVICTKATYFQWHYFHFPPKSFSTFSCWTKRGTICLFGANDCRCRALGYLSVTVHSHLNGHLPFKIPKRDLAFISYGYCPSH